MRNLTCKTQLHLKYELVNKLYKFLSFVGEQDDPHARPAPNQYQTALSSQEMFVGLCWRRV